MPELYVLGKQGMKSIPLDAIQRWSDSGIAWDDGAATTQPALALAATVGYLARAVEIRANGLAGMPWSIYRGGSETPLWGSETPRPPDALAAYATLPQLLYRTEASLCLTSTAYWFRERNRVRTTGLRWLDPTTTSPHWTAQGIDYFERSANGSLLQVDPADVVYIWQQGLSETEPKAPPAQVAAAEANVLFNLDQFVAAFFARGAIKATLLTVDGQPTAAEREKLKAWWGRFMAGLRSAFTAEVISAAVTPVVVGEGVSELSNTALTQEKREGISTAMGVPHSMVMSNAANYATAQADRQSFYELTVVPQSMLIEAQLNEQLFAPQGLRFAFRPQALSVFQADENERSAAFAQYVAAGLKPSLAAQLLGIDLPDGFTYADLDPQPSVSGTVLPPTGMTVPLTDDSAAAAGQGKAIEAAQFRRWLKKRPNADVTDFDAHYLSPSELAEVREAL